MKENMYKWANSIGWSGIILGAVVGVFVTTLVGPYVTFGGVHALNSVEAPLYDTPDIEVTMANESTFYEDGQTVPEFNNLTWKEEYSVYWISVKNTDDELIRDLDLYVPLPGCGVYTETEGPGVGGDYDVENILSTRLVPSARDKVQVYHCSKRFSAENLGPNEGFSARVVVTRDFDRCDLLVGYNPLANMRIKYSWIENGVRLSQNTTISAYELKEEYADASQFNISRATQGPGSWVEGTYYATVILGVETNSLNEGIEKCQDVSKNSP